MADENVLCIKQKDLPTDWLKERLSLDLSWHDFLQLATGLKAEFMPRNVIENNADYKQLIPYVLLSDQLGRTAFYRRCGSEKRLDGCFSIGIGGHIRDDDFTDAVFSWNELREKALQRELQEELPGFAPPASPLFLGLINEELTKVGHSHLGLVYLFENIDSENLVVGEELGQLNWAEPKQLFKEGQRHFEIWSELAFELISGLS
jgi:predicted NUDIX family phosphoesterase